MSTDPPFLNLLIPYPYMADFVFKLMDEIESRIAGVHWLLDSGAFTAWKGGKPISLDDYCAFLKSAPRTPWRYFALDIIGDGDGSWRNYQTMLDRGFRPIPVFTRGERIEMLDRYYETSDLVGIGGLVSANNPAKPYLKFLQPHLAGRRCHLLGFSSLDWLKYLRPYSADSSSCMSAARYGTLSLYMGRGIMRTMSRADYIKAVRTQAIIERVRAFGFDPSELVRPEAWRTEAAPMNILTMASWIAFSLDARRQLGTELFVVAMPRRQLPEALERALIATGHQPRSYAGKTAAP